MNPSEKININTGKVFPLSFIFFGLLLTAAGAFLIISDIKIIGLLLLPAGFIVSFSNYGIEVDPKKLYFNEYIRILGLRKNKKKKFSKIERLYIIKTNVSQRATSYGGTVSTFYEEIYEAYLRFCDMENRVFLLQNKNKEKLMNKLKPIAYVLNVTIEDRSEN